MPAAVQDKDGPCEVQLRSTRFPEAPLDPPCVLPKKTYTQHAGSVGAVSSFQFDPAKADLNISAGVSVVRLTFVADGILRVRLAPEGQFVDPTDGEIVELPAEPVHASFSASTTGFTFTSGMYTVSGSMSPLVLTFATNDGFPIWKESSPMSWNETSTWQTLEALGVEQVYGCGMQNGYYEHTGKVISISEGGGWDTGGRANPSPFFMTSRGWGMFRNTFSSGEYIFQTPRVLSHDDYGLDAFFFVGSDMKSVLGLYTSVSGRPLLPPVWGLWLGDSDCYNNERHGFNTSLAVEIARNYSVHQLPRGWMLVNDGYGCWYSSREALIHTEAGLAENGMRMGLWTSTGLANASWEIGVAGSRAIKTDVAWVGDGYGFGLKAVKEAANLMQSNSNSRPYTWTVCGWAGTQKYAVVWTGDNTGGWEYIRMQIPTVIGSGLSALAHASGDVDGIFGGSAETYVRDLQWKSFLTVAMTMSGWAPKDKQPWTYGEPYTTFNRRALELKAKLTPYLYSLSFEAFLTGVPPIRAMPLEFPLELWPRVNTSFSLMYEFMCGPWFLVAPVFEDASTRSGIALPEGEWVDFTTGERMTGTRVLDDYYAPLNIVPVFVRAGAVVPMWPLMQFVGQHRIDELTLDVYPTTQVQGKTTFTLYEDDGVTRNYSAGQVATQIFDVETTSPSFIVVGIGQSVGKYDGKVDNRRYMLQVHLTDIVGAIHLEPGIFVPKVECSQLSSTPIGWAVNCDGSPQQGLVVYINAGYVHADAEARVDINLATGGRASSKAFVV